MYPYVVTKEGEMVPISLELLKNRILFLNGVIDHKQSEILVEQLLYLDSLNHEAIKLYINSPGGEVSSGLAIYDTINFIQSDVETICIGQCCSMASILLAAGTKGKRACLKNSEVMIHQPFGGAEGKASEIEIATQHLLKTKERIIQIFARATGKRNAKVKKDMEQDYWLDAAEALDYGIIDFIV